MLKTRLLSTLDDLFKAFCHLMVTRICLKILSIFACNSISKTFYVSQSKRSSKTNKETNKIRAKTPNQLRAKLILLTKRLSLRNFMEYCVNALNEASTSSLANKFDYETYEAMVWLLGIRYELPKEALDFIEDVKSKIWITYRRNFSPLDEAGKFTADRGFGCMIRCGQMVLSNALLRKNLGRDWRWSNMGLELNSEVYLNVVKLFQDKESSPYSIHNIVQVSTQEGKSVGEWFGPNTIAQCLKRLSQSLTTDSIDPNFMISIDTALDNFVATDEVRSKFKRPELANAIGSDWLPGLLFIQLRLGLTKINPLYFEALKKTFELDSSLGIMGGRPNHALYLIGYVGDEVLYLDPHVTQEYVDLDLEEFDDKTNEEIKLTPRDNSYHCTNVEKMHIDKLDPSLALCFYFHSEKHFDDWCEQANDVLIKSIKTPMFEIAKSRPYTWDYAIPSASTGSTEFRNEIQKNVNTITPTMSATEGTSLVRTNHDIEMFNILKSEPSSSELCTKMKSPRKVFDDGDINKQDNGGNDEYDQDAEVDDEEFEMLG